jgi:hypothetical protein
MYGQPMRGAALWRLFKYFLADYLAIKGAVIRLGTRTPFEAIAGQHASVQHPKTKPVQGDEELNALAERLPAEIDAVFEWQQSQAPVGE